MIVEGARIGRLQALAWAGRQMAIQLQSDRLIQAHLSMLLIAGSSRAGGLRTSLLRHGLERAGGLQLDIRTRTEDYYERLGASRSLGFRLTRKNLGLDGANPR